MLSLSTAFISGGDMDGEKLLKVMENFNIQGIELDCRLSRTQYQQMLVHIGSSRLQVASLHNYCPFPAVKPGRSPSGDYFLLSSQDLEERRLAVEWTIRTIENANQLEAGAVVLHGGAVEMNTRHPDLYRMIDQGLGDSQPFRDLLDSELEKRERCKSKFLDALLFSLDRLLPVAVKQGVTLGLENRNHYFELPAKAEIELILKEFRGAPLGYWHDTGHAHINELLGIISQRELLATFAGDLVGIHLHDALGLSDHRAPGTGDIDFAALGSYLKAGHRLVVELAPGTSSTDVEYGIAYIRKLGEFDPTAENFDFFP